MELTWSWAFSMFTRDYKEFKNNYVKLREGMILSNEPGFYKKMILNKNRKSNFIKK